jgi:hypothetical protein
MVWEDGLMYDGPRIVDEVNPTQDEIRAWAYSGAMEPMEDWDIIVADLENVDLLLDLVGDQACPARRYLLGCLYCLVGHSDRADPRLLGAAHSAAQSADPWVATWARRVSQILADPAAFDRGAWCGPEGLRIDPG